MSAWTDSGEVRKYAAIKWDALNTKPSDPFADEDAFDDFLDETLIPRAQDHINKHCKRDFDVDYPGAVPAAVQDVAARATANMLQYMAANKMGPLVHETIFQISIPLQDVLSKDLIALLAPWVKRRTHTSATPYRTDRIVDDWNDPTPTQ